MEKKTLSRHLMADAAGLVTFYSDRQVKNALPPAWSIAVQAQYLALKTYASGQGEESPLNDYLESEGLDLDILEPSRKLRR